MIDVIRQGHSLTNKSYPTRNSNEYGFEEAIHFQSFSTINLLNFVFRRLFLTKSQQKMQKLCCFIFIYILHSIDSFAFILTFDVGSSKKNIVKNNFFFSKQNIWNSYMYPTVVVQSIPSTKITTCLTFKKILF